MILIQTYMEAVHVNVLIYSVIETNETYSPLKISVNIMQTKYELPVSKFYCNKSYT